MRRALLAVIPVLLALPQPAVAATDQFPRLTPAHAQTLVVDARRGRDSNPGSTRRPLKTVAAAWERIPERRALKRPVRILVRPGRYGERALPNYGRAGGERRRLRSSSPPRAAGRSRSPP
jgi:hypothetical protein